MLEKTEKPAKLRYADGHFDILSPGTYVLCAVTGERIPLTRLKYWSVARQEAYIDAAVSSQRELEVSGRSK